MVDTKAGRAFIEFFLKTDKMDRETRAMHRKMQRFGKSVMGVTAAFGALGAAAGGLAVAGIIKVVNEAGNLQEIIGKFDIVFGESAKEMRAWADQLAKSLGVAGAEVMQSMSGFQDLLVPMGMAADEAAAMSKQLTQLSIDLGAFNNMASADVVRDLQSALTGSSETMKKYGSIVNAAAVKQELLNQGLDPNNVTEAEKAMARFNIIMRTTTAAQGNAAATGETWNAQVRKLAVNWGNLQEVLGDKFLEPMTDLLRIANIGLIQMTEALDKLIPKFEGLGDAVIEMAKAGKWEMVGFMIGLQMELGLRRALGDTLVDLAQVFLQQQKAVLQGVDVGVRGVGAALGMTDQVMGGGRSGQIEGLLKQIAENSKKTAVEMENRPSFKAE